MKRSWMAVGLLAILGAVLVVRFFFGANPHSDAQSARSIATRGLIEAVIAQGTARKLLVMSNPYVRNSGTDKRIVGMEEAGLRGLRAAAEGRLPIGAVAYPELKPEARENPNAVEMDPDTTTPLSYLVAPDAFDRASGEHPDCDVIVSLIGLPAGLDQCQIWKREGAPSFALLLPDLRVVGDLAAVIAAVKSGKIAAAVLRKRDGLEDNVPPGKDWKAEFDQRFILVTRETIDAIARDTPGLLQSP